MMQEVIMLGHCTVEIDHGMLLLWTMGMETQLLSKISIL